jgi:hypothetical protein
VVAFPYTTNTLGVDGNAGKVIGANACDAPIRSAATLLVEADITRNI